MLTYFIIGLNVVISLICFSNQETFDKLYFSPYIIQTKKEWYRIFSHAFVHGDLGHLIFNMLTLFFFGRTIESQIMSSTEFILFYSSAIVLAALPTFQKQKNNPNYVAVGASGAVSAVMFVLVLYAPWELVYIKFIIPMYYILFAVGYLIYCTYQSKHAKDNVAHDVHLWGGLYGLAYTLLFHPTVLSSFIEQITHPPFMK